MRVTTLSARKLRLRGRDSSRNQRSDSPAPWVVADRGDSPPSIIETPQVSTRAGRYRLWQHDVDVVMRQEHRAGEKLFVDYPGQTLPIVDPGSWCNYFRHGVSSRTFGYLDHFAFWRIVGWLRKRHLGLNWGTLHRRFLPGWEVRDGGTEMFRPRAVPIVRYRYRGTRIPAPWTSAAPGSPVPAA